MEEESRVAVTAPDPGRTLEEFAPLVRRIVRALLRHRQEAEDAEQQTMVHILQGLPRFREAGSLEGWVRRIAVRTALRALQRRRWTSWLFADVPAPPPPSGDPELSARLYGALDRLTARERAAFVLKYQEGLAFSEVAAALGIFEGTARNYAFRASQKLRRLLGGTP